MIVYLIGPPGSGKSTVGRLVAARLGIPFVDLDEEIVREDGRDIARIFAEDGEERFRALEAKKLAEVAGADPAVVACGGGIVLEPANRVTLRATGAVVYLHAPIEVLRQRVPPASDRPLIRREGDLERLLAEREPLYREFAAHVVDATGPPEEVAARVEEELRWSS